MVSDGWHFVWHFLYNTSAKLERNLPISDKIKSASFHRCSVQYTFSSKFSDYFFASNVGAFLLASLFFVTQRGELYTITIAYCVDNLQCIGYFLLNKKIDELTSKNGSTENRTRVN